MESRFEIVQIRICPIYNQGYGKLKPDLNYPNRYCVIDKEKEIAVDINMGLKYDYLRTSSNLYFMYNDANKIKGNRRVALFPIEKFGFDYDVNSAELIIEKLKNGVEFQDGNEVFNNEQYLEYLNQEKLEKANEPQKVKQKTKIFKKGKK